MKTKMASIFAVLMIALMAVGLAYAHWEKIVYIDGTVTTGTLHVTPSLEAYLDQDKPVATLDYEVYPEKNAMDIWLDNVYPCLWVYGGIDFENDGTIPVNLVNVICDGNETLSLVPIEGGYEVYDGDKLVATLYLEYAFPDGFPQIDPGSTAWLNFDLHFEQDLPQKTSYWFHLEFVFWNWNEG